MLRSSFHICTTALRCCKPSKHRWLFDYQSLRLLLNVSNPHWLGCSDCCANTNVLTYLFAYLSSIGPILAIIKCAVWVSNLGAKIFWKRDSALHIFAYVGRQTCKCSGVLRTWLPSSSQTTPIVSHIEVLWSLYLDELNLSLLQFQIAYSLPVRKTKKEIMHSDHCVWVKIKILASAWLITGARPWAGKGGSELDKASAAHFLVCFVASNYHFILSL